MLRKYFPLWLKSDLVEFSLEVLSALALGFVAVCYLMGG